MLQLCHLTLKSTVGIFSDNVSIFLFNKYILLRHLVSLKKKKNNEVHLTTTTWAVKLLSKLLCNQQLNKGHDKRKPHRKELCVYIYIHILKQEFLFQKSNKKYVFASHPSPNLSNDRRIQN